jgi:DNA-binding NarL/FixJ family response regulator
MSCCRIHEAGVATTQLLGSGFIGGHGSQEEGPSPLSAASGPQATGPFCAQRDMPKKARIIIAEDHTIVREGLRALLSSDPGFEIVAEAEDGQQAVELVEKLVPDVVLMDLSMPRLHGLDAIREAKRRSPSTRILVLTVHRTEDHVLAAFEAGAGGYVLKSGSYAELVAATKAVLMDKPYISPAISDFVLEGYLEGKRKLKERSSWDTLTPREREVLKLIADGHKTREIADLLFISVRTAEKHRANLMKKLNLHSVTELTTLAIEKGLISE